jgi:hypothetical protein
MTVALSFDELPCPFSRALAYHVDVMAATIVAAWTSRPLAL